MNSDKSGEGLTVFNCCEACQHYRFTTGSNSGRCTVNPPVILPVFLDEQRFVGVWPEVKPDDRCGRFTLIPYVTAAEEDRAKSLHGLMQKNGLTTEPLKTGPVGPGSLEGWRTTPAERARQRQARAQEDLRRSEGEQSPASPHYGKRLWCTPADGCGECPKCREWAKQREGGAR